MIINKINLHYLASSKERLKVSKAAAPLSYSQSTGAKLELNITNQHGKLDDEFPLAPIFNRSVHYFQSLGWKSWPSELFAAASLKVCPLVQMPDLPRIKDVHHFSDNIT